MGGGIHGGPRTALFGGGKFVIYLSSVDTSEDSELGVGFMVGVAALGSSGPEFELRHR